MLVKPGRKNWYLEGRNRSAGSKRPFSGIRERHGQSIIANVDRDSEVFGNEINAVADISLQGEEGDRNWNSSTWARFILPNKRCPQLENYIRIASI